MSASVIISIITHLLATNRITTQYINQFLWYRAQLSKYVIHGLAHTETEMITDNWLFGLAFPVMLYKEEKDAIKSIEYLA